jgi:hypothetical protein
MHITGHCHCGAISFEADTDTSKVIACHCTDCQVFSGGPFRTVLPIPAEKLRLKGTPQTYVKVAASGNERLQGFCGTCGTHLYATEVGTPKVFGMRIGCIDQKAELTPTMQVWGQSAMPWLDKVVGDQRAPCHVQGPNSPVAVPAA